MTSHPIITALMSPTSVFICHYFPRLIPILRQHYTCAQVLLCANYDLDIFHVNMTNINQKLSILSPAISSRLCSESKLQFRKLLANVGNHHYQLSFTFTIWMRESREVATLST